MKDPFLTYDDKLYTYEYLHQYAEKWFNSNSAQVSSSLIAIPGKRSVDTIFQIASCWLQGVPFIVIPPDSPPAELETYKSITNGIEFSLNETSQYRNDSDLATVMFTSGTSGSPKVVPLKRGNLIAAATASLKNFALAPGEFWIHTLPMHHIGGISIILRALHSRSAILLSKDTSTDIVRTLINVDHSVVGASLVPTQLRRLLADTTLKPHSGFKGILLGGGPINADDIQSCIAKNLRVIPSFGMTETAAQCLAAPYDAWQQTPPGSCGIPLNGIEAELRPDPDDATSFLLWLRGDQVFDGYYGVSNREFDAEGWFCTGDYARRDDHGFYYIVMRRTDRIVSGGENINPSEIEQVIAAKNLISGDYAIIGIPDFEWGQTVALITTCEQTHSIDTIRMRLAGELSRFKLPKSLHIVDHIPTTAAGKIKRQELVAMVLKQINQ